MPAKERSEWSSTMHCEGFLKLNERLTAIRCAEESDRSLYKDTISSGSTHIKSTPTRVQESRIPPRDGASSQRAVTAVNCSANNKPSSTACPFTFTLIRIHHSHTYPPSASSTTPAPLPLRLLCTPSQSSQALH